jgi:hypothetical protein
MASIIGDLIAGILELAFWAVSENLPVVCYFTALALVFLVTFGRVAIEFPENLIKVGWTGQYRIARPLHGRTILSPALGVTIGFIIWVVIIGASIIFHSYHDG